MLQALGVLSEFEQLLLVKCSGKYSIESSVNKEDVDEVCCICYNWGVTLMELGQTVLAETFVSKALQFLRFSSPAMLGFERTIQVHFCKLCIFMSFFCRSLTQKFLKLSIFVERSDLNCK